uniref:uncharacterized protein LOC129502248 isoform X3 n=1 Tax=Nyctereutes procyonoides TaxID=34880 RepID=UPI002443A13B|nr:uncharacterized protein LOC129502248 isoform X3 [Nyctereutes procyonoides]
MAPRAWEGQGQASPEQGRATRMTATVGVAPCGPSPGLALHQSTKSADGWTKRHSPQALQLAQLQRDQWINPSCHSAAISPLGRGQQRPKECRTSVRWKLNRESVQKEAGRTFRKPEVTNSQTPSYSGELRGCHPATFPCLDGTFKVPGCLVSAGGHHTDIGFPSTRWTPWHLAGRDSRGPGASRPKAPGPLLHSRDGWLLHTSRVN